MDRFAIEGREEAGEDRGRFAAKKRANAKLPTSPMGDLGVTNLKD